MCTQTLASNIRNTKINILPGKQAIQLESQNLLGRGLVRPICLLLLTLFFLSLRGQVWLLIWDVSSLFIWMFTAINFTLNTEKILQNLVLQFLPVFWLFLRRRRGPGVPYSAIFGDITPSETHLKLTFVRCMISTEWLTPEWSLVFKALSPTFLARSSPDLTDSLHYLCCPNKLWALAAPSLMLIPFPNPSVPYALLKPHPPFKT